MATTPQNIPNEISREYRGRFVIDETELRRLVKDIETLLSIGAEDNVLNTSYLVGLINGIVYETDDIETVLKEENAQSLKIVLLVIYVRLVNKNSQELRGVLVHFQRGKINRALDLVQMKTGIKFNMLFEGWGYYIRDINRQSTLGILNKVEERLQKVRRFYSLLPQLNPDFPYIAFVLMYFVIGVFLYLSFIFFGNVLPPITISRGNIWERFIIPEFTATLAATIFAVFAVTVIIGLLVWITILILNWIVPPSIIAVGDEARTYKKQLRIREALFFTIIVGGLVSLAVNLITR